MISALLSLAIGCLIGYVDSRPTWDDTGITAGSIFLSSLLIAAWRPRTAWVTGLLMGTPVLALNAIIHRNIASIIAIVIALAGSAVGVLIAKGMGNDGPRQASPPP